MCFHRFVVACALCWLSTAAVAYGQQSLQAGRVGARPPRIDGALRDWRGAPFTALGSAETVLEGRAAWRGAHDASARVSLLWDPQTLFVAVDVRDDRFVRTARPGVREDAIVLTIAVPVDGGRFRATDVWLFAGIPGQSRAVLATSPVGGRPSPVARAQIVEEPVEGGYALEAAIPWSLVGVTELNRAEARAAVRMLDVDSEARPTVETVLGSARVGANALGELPALRTGADGGATLDAFLRSRDLAGAHPMHDLRGNVAGDARAERVVLVDRYLVVLGPGFREGRSFYFEDLPILGAAGVRSATLRDMDGDGHDDIVLVLRQQNELGSRDVYRVVSMAGESPVVLFEAEIRKELRTGGVIENRVEVRGRPLEIVISIARSSGVDAASWRESASRDSEPILLPWGEVRERRYRLTGGRFARSSETPNPQARSATAGTPASDAGARRAAPEAPAPPGTAALIAAFRREAGIDAREAPRFRREGNVAGDRQNEEVLVLGRNLVVVGPGFRGGTGWLQVGLPVVDPADVLDLRLVDLTGDGRAEMVLRLRRTTRYGSSSESVEVSRELLYVQQIRGDASARLLAVEIARTQGTSSIRHDVRFSREGAASRIEINARPATGWTRETWRFTEDPSGGIEPLLLPWETRAIVYRWDGTRIVGERR